jgi:hypothetical protein
LIVLRAHGSTEINRPRAVPPLKTGTAWPEGTATCGVAKAPSASQTFQDVQIVLKGKEGEKKGRERMRRGKEERRTNKHVNSSPIHSMPLLLSLLHCITLYSTPPHYRTALHNSASHYTALHNTTLHCTALHCTALHYIARHIRIIITFASSVPPPPGP